MPFSGNTFTRLYSWVNNAANNIKIRADMMDADTNDIAAALTQLAQGTNDITVKLADPAQGSNLVQYTASTTVNQRLALSKSMIADFGAKGDGTTDDTAAVQTAWASGVEVDGHGKTYKITAPITGMTNGTVIKNAFFDGSSYTSTGIYFKAQGTIGTGVPLTANTLYLGSTVTVGSTSTFVADGLVFLSSNAVWDAATSTVFGQYGRVKSVDSATQLTLYETVFLDFKTSDAAIISPVTPIKDAGLHNVRLIGSQSNTQQGFRFEYCEGLTIDRCSSDSVDYVHIPLYRCYGTTVTRTRMRYARATGLAYGIGVWGGCYDTKIEACSGEDLRHTVTVGDNAGLNLFTKVIGSHAIGSKDAGFESHAASMFFDVIGCTVHMSAARFGTSSHDGIISEGAHFKALGNRVWGAKTACIKYNPMFAPTNVLTTCTIDDNELNLDDVGVGGSTGVHVYVVVGTGGADIAAATITNNKFSGGQNNVGGTFNIYAEALLANSRIKRLDVTGNASVEPSTNFCLYVRAQGASSLITNVAVSCNQFSTSGGTRVMEFQADGASAQITYVTGGENALAGGSITAVTFDGGTSGSISTVRMGRNVFISPAPNPLYTIQNTCSDIVLEDANDQAPITVTPATVTVATDRNWYIFNRATAITVTLPSAATFPGRALRFSTLQSSVVSAGSDVVPATSTTPGTAILPATPGSTVVLKSDGTNWRAG